MFSCSSVVQCLSSKRRDFGDGRAGTANVGAFEHQARPAHDLTNHLDGEILRERLQVQCNVLFRLSHRILFGMQIEQST